MVKTNASAIVGDAHYGPSFGCHEGQPQGQPSQLDIFISDKANANKNSYARVGVCYDVPSGVGRTSLSNSQNKFLTLAGEKKHFTPDELEVFYLD